MASYHFSFCSNFRLANHLPPEVTIALILECLLTIVFLEIETDSHPCLMYDYIIQVSIYLPPLRLLRNVVERMKNLSNFVTISASQKGEFNLKVDTDMVTVATHFKDLEHPQWSMSWLK